jgi:hypothetical protein
MVEALASRRQQKITNPAVVMEYNKYRIGTDTSDQMMAYYSFQRKLVI